MLGVLSNSRAAGGSARGDCQGQRQAILNIRVVRGCQVVTQAPPFRPQDCRFLGVSHFPAIFAARDGRAACGPPASQCPPLNAFLTGHAARSPG